MVRTENEFPAQKTWTEVLCEHHKCQQFPLSDTVSALTLTQCSTCKSNHTLMAIVIMLSEHCPNAKITRIGIQNKWSAVIWVG